MPRLIRRGIPPRRPCILDAGPTPWCGGHLWGWASARAQHFCRDGRHAHHVSGGDASVESILPRVFSASSSRPTITAPACLASSALAPLANPRPAQLRRCPRERTTPAHHLVACRGRRPMTKFDGLIELAVARDFDQLHGFFDRVLLLARRLRGFLETLGCCMLSPLP